jgi:hypothetical protein
VTLYPSYFSTGQLPQCANWVFIFEKTLPDQGGRSKIDGLLCDGGATLTHEIGHQMVSRTDVYHCMLDVLQMHRR